MTDEVHVNFTKLRFVFWSLKKIFAARAAAMGGKATSKHFFYRSLLLSSALKKHSIMQCHLFIDIKRVSPINKTPIWQV